MRRLDIFGSGGAHEQCEAHSSRSGLVAAAAHYLPARPASRRHTTTVRSAAKGEIWIREIVRQLLLLQIVNLSESEVVEGVLKLIVQDEFGGKEFDEGAGRMGGTTDGVQAADREPGEKHQSQSLLRGSIFSTWGNL